MSMQVQRFKLKSGGFRELLNSGDVRDYVTSHAEPVLSAAKASAPVDTGAYRNSIHIEQDLTDRVAGGGVAAPPPPRVGEAGPRPQARALDAAG